MKCYNHQNIDAVASCSQGCGRALCSDCAQNYEPPTCAVCLQGMIDETEQQFAEARSSIVSKIIVNILFFIPYLILFSTQNPPGILFIPMLVWGFIGFRWLLRAFYSVTRMTIFATLGTWGKAYIFGSLVCSLFGFIVIPISLIVQLIQLSRIPKVKKEPEVIEVDEPLSTIPPSSSNSQLQNQVIEMVRQRLCLEDKISLDDDFTVDLGADDLDLAELLTDVEAEFLGRESAYARFVKDVEAKGSITTEETIERYGGNPIMQAQSFFAKDVRTVRELIDWIEQSQAEQRQALRGSHEEVDAAKPFKKKGIPLNKGTIWIAVLASVLVGNAIWWGWIDSPLYLTTGEVSAMLAEKSYYDYHRNPNGSGIEHQYESKTVNEDKIVIDHATDLTWQQSGSHNHMPFKKTNDYLKELNGNNYGGHNDWRLPTLEEAMSLMEREKNKSGRHIALIFDEKQTFIWTADKEMTDSFVSYAWFVSFGHSDVPRGFSDGGCHRSGVGTNVHVRAVR